MPPSDRAHALRARRLRVARHAHRLAGFVLVCALAAITLALTAFDTGSPARLPESMAGPSARLAPAGPPEAQIIALRGSLRLQLPVSQTSVTAIGYHASGEGALPLKPLGRQGNRGLLGRLVERIVGSERGGLVYYLLPGGSGAATSAVDIGAPPETDVFAPVDGTVIGITPYELSGKRRGVRVDIQPSSAPALVVSVTRLRPDPQLTVGSPVVAAVSRLGAVLDLSSVEEQALARFTQDAGNHVTLEVRAAATIALQ